MRRYASTLVSLVYRKHKRQAPIDSSFEYTISFFLKFFYKTYRTPILLMRLLFSAAETLFILNLANVEEISTPSIINYSIFSSNLIEETIKFDQKKGEFRPSRPLNWPIYIFFFVCAWVPISTTIKSGFNQAGFLFDLIGRTCKNLSLLEHLWKHDSECLLYPWQSSAITDFSASPILVIELSSQSLETF